MTPRRVTFITLSIVCSTIAALTLAFLLPRSHAPARPAIEREFQEHELHNPEPANLREIVRAARDVVLKQPGAPPAGLDHCRVSVRPLEDGTYKVMFLRKSGSAPEGSRTYIYMARVSETQGKVTAKSAGVVVTQ